MIRDAADLKRGRFVRDQQERGREALARGDIQGARTYLSVLHPGDFEGATVISEVCLRVLGEEQATDESIHAALKILGRLPVRTS